MALQISLVWIADTTDVDEISLVDFTDGFMPALNGWVQQVAKDRQHSLIETMTLQVRAASHDDLAEIIQALDVWKKRIRWSRDPTETRQVWLRVAIEEETAARQAQVLELDYLLGTSLLDQQVAQAYLLRGLTLAIERTPYWEMVAPYPTTTSLTDVSCIGGIQQISNTIDGDVPARIAEIRILPQQIATTFYLGWRSTWHGTLGNFIPVWPLSDATIIYSGGVAADPTAYSGNLVQCSLSGTMTTHIIILTNDISHSYFNDQRGTYSVIARARMTDTSTAWTRIGFGYENFSHAHPIIDYPTYRDRVEISGTGWKLYPLGAVSIPPDRNSESIDNVGIQIEAQRTSGAGYLELDCLIMIPIDEGALTTVFPELAAGNTFSIRIRSLANGESNGVIKYDAFGLTLASTSVEDTDWALPANNESPALVVAGQASASVLADAADIAFTYIPRWRTLRGAADAP